MIVNRMEEHQAMVNDMLYDVELMSQVKAVVSLMTERFEEGKKLLLCGNGGSAADAQHLAAEFSGRFYLNRRPLDAEALHVNTSYLTAVGNDYDFDTIYERAVEAKGHQGDVLFALSTSGNSTNVIRACKRAKEMNIICVGFTGSKESALEACCDYLIKIPSTNTPRIQEGHMLIGHIICELVEGAIFGE